MCRQRKYVQFHNIKYKMPKSLLLIGLETSFKNWQKAQHVTFIPHQKHTSGVSPLPLASVLYTCENVDNYGWPLRDLVILGRRHWGRCYHVSPYLEEDTEGVAITFLPTFFFQPIRCYTAKQLECQPHHTAILDLLYELNS